MPCLVSTYVNLAVKGIKYIFTKEKLTIYIASFSIFELVCVFWLYCTVYLWGYYVLFCLIRMAHSITRFYFVLPHCKDRMPKIWYKYSQKRNIGASVLISTFMCLWANYIFPRWVCLFCRRKYVDRSWELNRSQTHECRNWGWGRAIPRKGIYKRNCRCSAGSSHTTVPIAENNMSINCVV